LWLPTDELHPAGGAAPIASAGVHVVRAMVGKGKYQSRPSFNIEFTDSAYG